MSSSMQLATLLVALLTITQPGCDTPSSTDKLKISFEEMKSATIAFHEVLCEVTDAQSADALLPKLEETHHRLAISVHELNELNEITSARSSATIKRDIDDFKEVQKVQMKEEFNRLKSDKFIKAILEPFLHRMNVF